MDDHPFLRTGTLIPCATKQYAGNGPLRLCQVGVSWHAVSPRGSSPLAWRLFMPEAWADDPERRRRARIPDHLEHETKHVLALRTLDELAALGLRPPLVTADALYGQSAAFRQGLSDRSIPFVLAVPGNTTLLQATSKPTTAWVREKEEQTAYATAQCARPKAVRLCYRQAAHGHLARFGYFATVRVHAAGRAPRRTAADSGGPLPEYTLLAQWRHSPGEEPGEQAHRIWLADLPASTPLTTLVHHATSRWEIETDYKDMNQHLGLGHYEGRTWPGFHHHVTLVSAAHLFCLEQRLDPKAPPGT